MPDQDHSNRYAELIEEGVSSGKIDVIAEAREGRNHPRFKFEDTALFIDIRLQVTAYDISRSGFSFLTRSQFEAGQIFALNVGTIFSINAEVLACVMQETDEDFMEAQYRVHSKFIKTEMAFQQLIDLMEQDG